MADLKPVYKKINGDWVKQTAYERQSGAWVLISTAEQASYYLHGTQSENGNVAIAEGDGYVLYNGAVLPKLPEWAGYSHVVVYYSLEHYYLRAYANKPTTAHYDPILPGDSYDRLVAEGDWHSAMLGDDGNWSFDDETSNDSKGAALKLDTIVWANVDISTSDNEPFMSASDPIPLASNEPVAAVYGGKELPIVPEEEAYPYAHIYDAGSFWMGDAYLYRTDKPMAYYPDNYYKLGAADGGTFNYSFYIRQKMADGSYDTKWSFQRHTADADSAGSSAIWTNHDIYNEDGTLYLAESDPIPVYEIKE